MNNSNRVTVPISAPPARTAGEQFSNRLRDVAHAIRRLDSVPRGIRRAVEELELAVDREVSP